MKRIMCTLFLFSFFTLLSACSNPCRDGHTWIEATCTKQKTCSVCEETEGEPLGHNWSEATCSTPAVCSLCGEENYFMMPSHSYSKQGVCTVCSATKEYGNSYGYFSKSDLYAMAKDAVENYVYPSYVSNYCSVSNIVVDKVTDSKLGYGYDSYTIGAYADFTVNGVIFESRKFAAVIEPRDSSTYMKKDVYVQFVNPTVVK